MLRTMAVETVLSTVSETRSCAAHRFYCGLQQLCKRQWLRAKGCLKTQTAHSTLLWAVGRLLGLAEGAQGLCESQFRQDLKAHALSLSHLTFVTTIRILHLLDRPPFPCKARIQSLNSEVKSSGTDGVSSLYLAFFQPGLGACCASLHRRLHLLMQALHF